MKHTAALLVLCLVFTALFTMAQDDIYEPNNSAAQAAEITPGVYHLEAMDVDWFIVRNLEAGMLYVSLTHPDGVPVLLNLYTDDETPLWANLGTLQLHRIEGGDYLLRVATTNSSLSNSYTMTVGNSFNYPGDDANDAGSGDDNIADATQLPSSEANVTNQVSLDSDWFKFDALPGELTINLNFNPDQGNINLELYNPDQVRILTSVGRSAGENGRSLTYEVPDTGAYYIAIYGETGNTYSLEVDLPTVWVTPLNFGPARFASATVYDVDGDGRDEILVGTGKTLDGALNEIRPAALICLEDDGSVKWTRSFPAMAGPDPQTGIVYNTTSIGSTPVVGDVDGDGQVDVVVGVGADSGGHAQDILGQLLVGEPGDRGGVYAVNGATGAIKWFHEALDVIGGADNTGEGRPDGVFSSPVITDLDEDGEMEVIYGGWDQRVRVLNGSDGSAKPGWPVHVLDTVWSSPAVADIDGDASPDILIGADITANQEAGIPNTGGIFHVFNMMGVEDIPGFDERINTSQPQADPVVGKYEAQTIWSSPFVGDLDGDTFPEIAYGTSFFGEIPEEGQFIRIWNHDGSEYQTLPTSGRTFPSPLFADLDGDGGMEVIAATENGLLYVWESNGANRFTRQATHWPGTNPNNRIVSSPLAVDINGDNRLEIIYNQGFQIVILDADGNQLSDANRRLMVFGSEFVGSPAVKDIDRDGRLDFISPGVAVGVDPPQLAVYRFRYGKSTTNGINNRYARRQFREPNITSVQVVAIPDANFRAFVSANFDQNENGAITTNEIDGVTQLDVSDQGIESLEGLSFFSALQVLNASGNRIAGLPEGMAVMTGLRDVDLSYNLLTDIGPAADNNNLGGAANHRILLNNNLLTAGDCTDLETLIVRANGSGATLIYNPQGDPGNFSASFAMWPSLNMLDLVSRVTESTQTYTICD